MCNINEMVKRNDKLWNAVTYWPDFTVKEKKCRITYDEDKWSRGGGRFEPSLYYGARVWYYTLAPLDWTLITETLTAFSNRPYNYCYRNPFVQTKLRKLNIQILIFYFCMQVDIWSNIFYKIININRLFGTR